MLNVKQLSKSKQLQDVAFVQLKNPETGDLEFTKKEQKNEDGEIELVNDKKIGFELHSMHSKEFKRALRSTVSHDLTKDEKKKHDEIKSSIDAGKDASDADLDFLDYCEQKTTERMQLVFAMVTKKLHYIELNQEDADAIGVKVGKGGKVVETVDNIHKLYVALPDLSAQIGTGVAVKENFIKS